MDSTKNKAEDEGGCEIILLCLSAEGDWYRVEHPEFLDEKEAIIWLNQNLENEELSEWDDYFFSKKMSREEFMGKLCDR